MIFSFLLVIGATCTLGFETPFNSTHFFNRIVGGTEAEPYTHPYIVAIRTSRGHFCGGSIINANYILSAAHCGHNQSPRNFQIVAGEHNNEQNEGPEQVRRVAEIINHPNYDPDTYDNDIAIWRLSTPLELNEYAVRTTLPPDNFAPRGNGLVAGWGAFYSQGPAPADLYEVQVPLVANNECHRRYQRSRDRPNEITSNMMCAGTEDKDSCQGDSGGPLMCNNGGRLVQAGVVSWGHGCGHANFPGVYARVSRYNAWIRRVSGG